ncbi:MAG: energy transducer TonB [Acidobacteria bacterium]|nr:energy transducer TonB [Acidobacteriota bacterium]
MLIFVYALLLCGLAYSQDPEPASRKIVKSPAIIMPEAAKAAGIYGTLLVEVNVDESGKVKDVIQVQGPDWTCPNYESPGLEALRAYAKREAESVKFEPLRDNKNDKDERHWVEFKFVAPTTNTRIENVKTVSPQPIIGGVLNGKATDLKKPVYPEAARRMRATGTVAIRILIDEKGKVMTAEVISGHPLLAAPSRAAACYSKFSPTTLKGHPVKVTGRILYTFVP